MNDRERLERQHVIDRDGRCVFAILDPEHVCRRLGVPHRSDAKHLLTVEHVKHRGMLAMGRRAPSDRRHMVACCLDKNVAVPSKVEREILRTYLEEVNREKRR